MSTERAPKSGYAREAQEKIDSKYSEADACEVLEWIRNLTGHPDDVSGDQDNVYNVLRDGMVLCELMNAIQPGTITKMQQSKLAFKCMENINLFLEAVKAFGLPPTELFQTVDLWERQNLHSVVFCLISLKHRSGNYENASNGNEVVVQPPKESVSVEKTTPSLEEPVSIEGTDKSLNKSGSTKKSNKTSNAVKCCFCWLQLTFPPANIDFIDLFYLYWSFLLWRYTGADDYLF